MTGECETAKPFGVPSFAHQKQRQTEGRIMKAVSDFQPLAPRRARRWRQRWPDAHERTMLCRLRTVCRRCVDRSRADNGDLSPRAGSAWRNPVAADAAGARRDERFDILSLTLHLNGGFHRLHRAARKLLNPDERDPGNSPHHAERGVEAQTLRRAKQARQRRPQAFSRAAWPLRATGSWE